MCGIIGFNGFTRASPVLLEGITNLEYRGYDSVGMATVDNGVISVKKGVGKIADVHSRINFDSLKGSIGLSHCLHPDSFVQLSSGEITKIGELNGLQQGVSSLSFDSLKFGEKDSACFRHESPKELVELKTASFSLKCTPNHRMFVYENNSFAEKQAGDLKKNDLIVCVNTLRFSGESQQLKPLPIKRYYLSTLSTAAHLRELAKKIGYSNPEICRMAGITRSELEHALKGDRNVREDILNKLCLSLGADRNLFAPVDSIHGKFVSLPAQTSPALMEFLGYLLGDGIVNKRSIRFKDADPVLLAHYNKACQNLFGASGRIVKVPEANCYLLEINSKTVCDWISLNFPSLIKRFSEKDIPSLVGKCYVGEVNAFLRGLFDAESCVNSRSGQVIICMKSERIMRVAQMLLLRNSIVSSFSVRPTKWGDAFGLSVNNFDSLNSFNQSVSFNSYQKKSKLEQLLGGMSKRSSTCFKLPLTWRQLKPFASKKSLFKQDYLVSNSSISKAKAGLLQQFQEQVQKFADADIFFQRIASVKTIASDTPFVYDLSVPTTENFVANGFLSHNSRWATHGNVTEANCHPHFSSDQKIAVVHNGIIENYAQVKKILEKKGRKFRSQTDTEVIPMLIEEEFKKTKDLLKAVRSALLQLTGSYAIIVVSTLEPGKMIVARQDSPLLIGYAQDGLFAASDVTAFSKYTNKVVFLKDGQLAVLYKDKADFFDLKSGKHVIETPKKIDVNSKATVKEGFPHFMLKEIHEQPVAIKTALAQEEEKLNKIAKQILDARKVIISACGTSRHASLVGRYVFQKMTGKHLEVIMSSEYGYFADQADANTLVIAVSQSGETADVLDGVKKAKAKGARVISIVNTVGSTLTRLSDDTIYLNCGTEIGVAA
ncbi:isomerizing glutamine--fructose-6-phosphate transaminase, partial [Candidatus Micrarchaeota archaeon]|nr:isomerizing glutamine--fructose-6-phosphate transaminase [Candidatus Micrarchaeota archaeon]